MARQSRQGTDHQTGAIRSPRRRNRSRADLPCPQSAAGVLMPSILSFGEIAVDVTFKDIKNVHLSVHPPFGSVRVAAPNRMRLDQIRLFVISKLMWIKEQQRELREQERETPRD